ncbi:MAG: GNAT family N-acetyltransferase [Leptospiraceae bacterium]|nr:GNAT family N-acetyltransferase [Leptospiraceae bacterium]
MYIKLLDKSSVEYLKELNVLFSHAFDDQENYQKFSPSDNYLNKLLSKEDILCYVALEKLENQTQREILVGGLVAYVLEKFEQERKEIYIYDLAVDERFRRKGIARSLINALKVKAKEISASVIYVQADYGDDPAIQLYTSMGVKEKVLHFDIQVE